MAASDVGMQTVTNHSMAILFPQSDQHINTDSGRAFNEEARGMFQIVNSRKPSEGKLDADQQAESTCSDMNIINWSLCKHIRKQVPPTKAFPFFERWLLQQRSVNPFHFLVAPEPELCAINYTPGCEDTVPILWCILIQQVVWELDGSLVWHVPGNLFFPHMGV